jgi:hypothetical protein
MKMTSQLKFLVTNSSNLEIHSVEKQKFSKLKAILGEEIL